MNRRAFLAIPAALAAAPRTREIPAADLEDKIRGGLLGQLIGDLNGLPHEMKYIADPGDVREYTPALPDGAWTDDDTDIEWPYLLEIERSGALLIPYPRIAELWKRHINRRIWCSHLFLRRLLDIGIEPPLTGRPEINPWASFNLSGQFVAETWGLISPGMPRTAARIGVHYTHVSIDGEAIQSTQMIAAMIAAAFFTSDIGAILDAGAIALDPKSVMSAIVSDVRRWAREHPDDWRATRRLTKEKYCRYGGQDMRDRNGVWLNGASTIAALLYGGGAFIPTLRAAFNLGWDADNNAAAAGTILGVIKGARWFTSQGWNLQDRYRNTSRDQVPDDETITRHGDRLVTIARKNIVERGGAVAKSAYRIPVEDAANVEPLPDPDPDRRRAALAAQLRSAIDRDLASPDSVSQARAAYLAICLDLAAGLRQRRPEPWSAAVRALAGQAGVMQAIFREAPFPAGDLLRDRARAAGIQSP